VTTKLLLGSNNAKKRKELAEILEGLDIELVVPADLGDFEEPEETGTTFEENAGIKAAYYAEKTGLPTLADDSGLVVDALHGKPGVHSSRYAGEQATDLDNCKKLLDALADVPEPERTARFMCCIVVVHEGSVVGTAEGACEGVILKEMKGAGGFGYDPLFLYEPEALTFAELPAESKNRISHRARALQGIRPVLEKLTERLDG
jgi:XTP/dITP diphosphohydrolase